MRIIITDLEGNEVDSITTYPNTLDADIEKVKTKYPIGKFHATLKTF